MFSVGDLVQPRAGGPKLKVVEVQDDHYCRSGKQRAG